MSQTKQRSKRKSRSKTLPVLGAAGLSLSLTSAASAIPSGLADMPTSKTGDDNRVTIGEEDIGLAPFYAFDKESEGTAQSDIELVRGGCGGCHGLSPFGATVRLRLRSRQYLSAHAAVQHVQRSGII